MFEIPDFIEQETWDAFERERARMKKPLSDFARKRVIHKLIDFHCKGYNADEMLGEAVERGWRTVFMYADAPMRKQTVQEQANAAKILHLASSAVRRMQHDNRSS